jgi:hypothetical protein
LHHPDAIPVSDGVVEMGESPATSSKLGIILSLGIACCLFLYQFGAHILDPTNIGFIFKVGSDLAQNYLGWAFLRGAPWSFPLGKITNYFAPIGTYAAYTVLNPLVWIPFKLLSPILPVDFQYFGWWLLACSCLQAYFGYRLMRLITSNILEQLLGVGFFLLSPPLLIRSFYCLDTLFAQWLILASLVIYFDNYSEIPNNKLMLYWSLLIIGAFTIMPYFGPMVIGLALAFYIRLFIWSPASRSKAALSISVFPLLIFACYIIFGYYKTGAYYNDLTGYGTYSLNLNAFINPLGWSSFLPALPYRLGQGLESFNYLGLGIIILICYGIIHSIIRPPKIDRIKYLLPLVIVIFLFFIYAISPKVTWGNTLVFKYYLPEPLLKIANMFRSSGRFGWPLFYAILFGALFLVTATKRKSLAVSVMCICLAVQLADIHRLLYAPDFHITGPVVSPLKSSLWQSVGTKFNKVIVYPPFIRTVTNDDDWKYLALYAYKHHMSIDTGYLARDPLTEMRASQEELKSALQEGDLDPQSIYIFTDPPASETVQSFHRWNQCALVDGFIVYTSDDHFFNGSNRIKIEPVTLYDFFKKFAQDTILIAAREYQAPVLLPGDVKKYLQEKGSRLPGLLFRGSYVGIFSHGAKIFEKIDDKGAVKIELRQGELIGKDRLTKDIALYSAGVPFGNQASIKVSGVEQSRDRGGLNMVVLNGDGAVLVSTIFDAKTGSKINLCTRVVSPGNLVTKPPPLSAQPSNLTE